MTYQDKKLIEPIIRDHIDTELKTPSLLNDEKIKQLILWSERNGLSIDFIEEIKGKL